MLRVPLSNPALKRTLRPLYANHQATPYGGFLDPAFSITAFAADIYPGTVMAKVALAADKGGELFRPYIADGTQKPFGLSALFVAPSLGVNEVTSSDTNLFTVWVGGNDAVFEITAPAFDATATWQLPTNGSIQLLTATNKGLLTPTGATAANACAELIDLIGTTKIIVRLRQVV